MHAQSGGHYENAGIKGKGIIKQLRTECTQHILIEKNPSNQF